MKSKYPEVPDDLNERDRIIMRAICDHNMPSMSLHDLGFGGTKWAKAFARVRKRFSIEPALGRKRYRTPDENTKKQMRLAASHDAMRITSHQHEVLLELSDGAMSSNDLADALCMRQDTVRITLRKLRELGLVVQRHIACKQYLYELVEPYQELEKRFFIDDARTKPRISDIEARYYAILRNSGLTGLSLLDQFCKIFPHRSSNSVNSNVRAAALKQGLCR